VPYYGVDDRALYRAQHVAQAGDDDMLHRRVRQCLLQNRGEILDDENGFSARVAELEFQFARLVEWIDVHHCEAGTQDRGDSHRILQHVRHHDGDAGAAREAARLQPGCQRARGFIETRIGQRCTHTDAGRVRSVFLETLLKYCD
jgi:hypothetical protein